MARKVFISFLGTTNYQACTYTRDKKDFGPTRFIQEATLQYLLSLEKWTENDRILILLTSNAKSRNWVDEGQYDLDTKAPIKGLKGLKSCLQPFPPSIDTLDNLPEGINEEDIWSIFGRIYDYLQDDDLLYFDLTHGFRYLPMLVLVLGNYAKFLKNVQIRSITYGNWEISGGGRRPAPIVDLLPLSTLQDWTYAAGQILENGNANELFSLSRSEYSPLLKASLGKDEQARNLKNFADSIKHLVDDCRSCRGLPVMEGKTVSLMRETLKALPESTLRPYSPIFQKIAESFEPFSASSDPLNIFHVAKWCFDKGLYQQAATYLVEAIKYKCCIIFNLDPIISNDQNLLSEAFHYAANKKSGKNEDNYSEVQKRMGEVLLERYESLINPYGDLRETIRNDFNHAGIRQNPRKGNALIQRLGELIQTINPIFLDEAKTREPVFINLSNHPSKYWSEKQLAAAKAYGGIVDIEFPTIDPGTSEDRIQSMADDIVKDYLHFLPSECTFHIMGEMTLTYRLVSRFKALRFKCLASTTTRDVHYDGNGDKIVSFDFSGFREY